MSYLREIMERLSAARTARQPLEEQPSSADATGLEHHLRSYQGQLQLCSPAMLQYEWAWMEEHIDALELCCSQPEHLAGAGGQGRVRALLEESLRFRDLLAAEMASRQVEPAQHRGTLVASEHAWELGLASIRRQWGIESAPP